jgi:hypothetical protein
MPTDSRFEDLVQGNGFRTQLTETEHLAHVVA